MFSSIFRQPRSKRRHRQSHASPGASTGREETSHTANFQRRDRSLSRDVNVYTARRDGNEDEDEDNQSVDADEDDENGQSSSGADTPLLPIFDSAVLDALPVYGLTHTIRLMVIEKCETVLSWDQLRSPQISQFLVRPMQQAIRSDQFSAATLYALLANCLQFTKETATTLGNSGTCKTQAMICELLAIKLLREYDTRSLIDALSYDFDPLQGQTNSAAATSGWQGPRKAVTKTARISCLEIAIRAQAKRFLSHPLVVQQLQAIWDGSIVFHNASDNLHRQSMALNPPSYGTTTTAWAPRERKASSLDLRQRKVVTLYNPRDASLFKLSRLRVPRYRNLLSTLSFAVLLGLFVAVLTERSLEITPLEILFWFWTAGYMIDEVVTFTEQGFNLYIASFWNTFDLGILLLLIVHLCLRVYGLVTPTAHKHLIADTAYDVLASTAVLLFPRLFSVLDHYRYFSQLLIAFKMMAVDLAAVFVLIVIACSGFWIALSLSFGQQSPDDPKSIGFALFQLLLGFTPAAWDRWGLYTPLGRVILTLYMFITHFVIVTILVSVLTNSFMAVVQNAHEEHQFLFAVNTISSVKSDSLFSYVPPLNILQWLLTPCRYFLPFRRYIQWNRSAIKITHLPILFCIYIYERAILRTSVVDSIDIIERRSKRKTLTQHLPRLLREPSVVNFRQDQALEEVFRRPFDDTVRTGFGKPQRKSSNVVNKWMNAVHEEEAGPPEEQDPKIVNKLEKRRFTRRTISAYSRGRNASRRTMSVASDPADIASNTDFFSPSPRMKAVTRSRVPVHLDDGDGDDEHLSNEADDDDRLTTDHQDQVKPTAPAQPASGHFYLSSAPPAKTQRELTYTSVSASPTDNEMRLPDTARVNKPHVHQRTVSASTMIFNPSRQIPMPQSVKTAEKSIAGSADVPSELATSASKRSLDSSGQKSTRKKPRSRPLLPNRGELTFQSTPNLNKLLQPPPRRTSLEMDLVSDIGDNKAIGGGYVGAIPASFATQMAYAAGGLRQLQRDRQEDQERLSRIMMARMNSLEEGFRDVIHEMRESLKMHSGTTSRRTTSPERSLKLPSPRKPRDPIKSKLKRPDTATSDSPDRNQVNDQSSSLQITIDPPEQDQEHVSTTKAFSE